MKRNSENVRERIDRFFKAPLTPNRKAWRLATNFASLILNRMEEQGINQSELARKLGISRSSISQFFNKTPNATIRRMVEIADAVDVDIEIVTADDKRQLDWLKAMQKEYGFVVFSKSMTLESPGGTVQDQSHSSLKNSDLEGGLDWTPMRYVHEKADDTDNIAKAV